MPGARGSHADAIPTIDRTLGPSRLAHGARPRLAKLALDPAFKSITADGIFQHIKVLASDEYEGRGPGTPGEEKTVAYLTGQLREMGLKPGNPDGTLCSEGTAGWLSGYAGPGVVPGGRPGRSLSSFPGTSSAVSGGWPEDSPRSRTRTIVFVGYGVVAPEYGWDDYKGLDVRGKTLIMLVNDPPVPDPKDPSKLDPAVFKGRAMTYYGRWTYKYEIAAEEGSGGRDPGARDRTGGLPVRGGPGQLEPRELRHRPARRPPVAAPAWR